MRTEILIIIGLFLGVFIQVASYFSSNKRFEVMPVFTPVSLQYEKEYLGGKKPIRNPDIVQFLRELPEEKKDPKQIEQLKKEREELLDLRNERHDLNIKMMENAVSLLSELTPEQWAFIQSNRDEIQSKIELDIMEKIMND